MLKFLLLSLIITGVWYGFRYVNRPRGGGQPPARPKTPPDSPSQAQPQAPAQMRAEDMTACPVCGTYVAESTARSCGRGDLPYPAACRGNPHQARSEERRGGKQCVRDGHSRWWPDH